jgi:hypothetical protein
MQISYFLKSIAKAMFMGMDTCTKTLAHPFLPRILHPYVGLYQNILDERSSIFMGSQLPKWIKISAKRKKAVCERRKNGQLVAIYHFSKI